MKARGSRELTTIELPNELRFTVIWHDGWIAWIFRILLLAFLTFILFTPLPHFLWWQRSALVFFWLLAASRPLLWLREGTSTLRVTSSELFATGNLGKLWSTSTTIPANEVTWLGFNETGQNMEGLRIEGLETDVDALPLLTREQAEAIANTILKRFPSIRPDFPR
jgi:hypothetical protein